MLSECVREGNYSNTSHHRVENSAAASNNGNAIMDCEQQEHNNSNKSISNSADKQRFSFSKEIVVSYY